jgi:hypothetical protein
MNDDTCQSLVSKLAKHAATVPHRSGRFNAELLEVSLTVTVELVRTRINILVRPH